MSRSDNSRGNGLENDLPGVTDRLARSVESLSHGARRGIVEHTLIGLQEPQN
jgi:hypothetical protein